MSVVSSARELAEFYRARDWYLHLGVPVLFLLAADSFVLLPALSGMLQVVLLGMFVFSFNDYSDGYWWGEQNYVSSLERRKALLLVLAPLFLLVPLALRSVPYSAAAGFLVVSAYVYQGMPRMKENYLFSLVLNAVTFPVVYVYPAVLMVHGLNPVSVYLFLVFVAHMLFFEAAHQTEHHEKEPMRSIADRMENPVRKAGYLVYTVVAVTGLYLALTGFHPFIAGTATAFSAFRLFVLYRQPGVSPRKSWHKFYMLFEALAYMLLLFF